MVIGTVVGAGMATRALSKLKQSKALRKLKEAQQQQAEKLSDSAKRIKQELHERREAKKRQAFEDKSFKDRVRAEEEAKYEQEYKRELIRARAKQKVEREAKMREDIRERVRRGHAPLKEKAGFYLRDLQQKTIKTHGVVQQKIRDAQTELKQAQQELGGAFGDIDKESDKLIGIKPNKKMPNLKNDFMFGDFGRHRYRRKSKRKNNDLIFTGL